MATASNSYAYNAEDLAELERYHDAGEILNDNIEKFKVGKKTTATRIGLYMASEISARCHWRRE